MFYIHIYGGGYVDEMIPGLGRAEVKKLSEGVLEVLVHEGSHMDICILPILTYGAQA